MAGSISLSLSQQFDPLGKPYGGGKVYFIKAGTVATPQNAYQDLGLTLPWPNPYTLLDDGRIPQVYFADGYIKLRITDKTGVEIFNQDNIPVVGPSSGGGGGGGVDPTTIIQTGWIQPIYGTGVVSGFVRINGRTIGSATSGATERANADTAALFAFLYNADPSLVVSGGRGASAAADYAANKTIALPDVRGRVIAGLDDMGNSAASRLSTTYFGASPTVLGAASTFTDSRTLVTGNLPPYTPAGSVSTTATIGGGFGLIVTAGGNALAGTGSSLGAVLPTGSVSSLTTSASFSGSAQGGFSAPFSAIPPTILATYYIKL